MRGTMSADRPRISRRARVRLDGLFAALVDNLDRVREGDRGEALHDARVAARRLREGLAVYAGNIAPSRCRKARSALRSLARSLGGARDHEATLALVERVAGEHPGIDAGWIVARARSLHQASYRRMSRGVEALDHDHWRRRVRDALRDARDGDRAPRRARQLTLDAARTRLEVFLTRGAAIETPEAVESLHRLRIAARRLRYTMEFLKRDLDGAEAIATELRGLQDTLGAVHDCDVLSASLRGLTRRKNLPAPRRRSLLALLDATENRRATLWEDAHAAWRSAATSHLAARVRALLEGAS